jgi:DnaJ-domain-containing protein 1
LSTDYFAVLNEPRRPWIEAEALKKRFLAFSADAHPDRVHSASQQEKESAHQRYLEIHAAYNCLRDPKMRLRHFLELERGAKPPEVQTVPPGLLELFMEVGQVSRAVDAFLAERARTTSPLLKAQLFAQASQRERDISALHTRLSSLRENLDAELKTLNDAWAMSENPSLAACSSSESPRLEPNPLVSTSLPLPQGEGRGEGSATDRCVLLSRLEEMYRLFSYFSGWLAQLSERQFKLLDNA